MVQGSADGDDRRPAGSSYDWYVRATALLDAGDASAAAQLLARLSAEEPGSRAVLEALARALYDSRRYDEAAAVFGDLVEGAPDDDYAHFGLGLSLWRLQRFNPAGEHLAMAAVMRPDRVEYRRALEQVRATQRARAEAGLAPEGPPTVLPRAGEDAAGQEPGGTGRPSGQPGGRA